MHYLSVKKISSHILWGLYYKDKGNLYHGLYQYHSNDAYRTRVNADIKKIQQHWFLIRLMYLIFNISNYHQNLYTSFLHKSLTKESNFDEKKVCTQQASQTDSFWAALFFKFVSCVGISYFLIKGSYYYSIFSNISLDENQLSDLETPLTLDEKARYYEFQLSISKFEITADMQVHLGILGLNPDRSKTHISKKEIVDAYHKLARRYHTDKGGEATDFHRITEAKEALLSLMGTDRMQTSLQRINSLRSAQAIIKAKQASIDKSGISLFAEKNSNTPSPDKPANTLNCND